jgi:hypothetical protein
MELPEIQILVAAAMLLAAIAEWAARRNIADRPQ